MHVHQSLSLSLGRSHSHSQNHSRKALLRLQLIQSPMSWQRCDSSWQA